MKSPGPQGKTVLVVDDDETVCDFFKTILERDGFGVHTVHSGDQALRILQSNLFEQVDLVLLDLMMPGRGGYDVLKELQSPDCQNIPIIVITARALDAQTIETIKLESNVKGFFAKPPNILGLREAIYTALGMKLPGAKSFNEWDRS